MTARQIFSGRAGFVLAAAAAAIGLGNVWRFPYLASKYGGGIFILIYLALVVTLGFALMVTEIAIGRMTGKNALWAFGALHKKWKSLGVLSLVVPILLLMVYVVIGGWLIEYFILYLTNQGALAASAGFFDSFVSGTTAPIVCMAVFLVLSSVILLFGVRKGIERICRISVPLLIAIMIGLTIYCMTLPGAFDGLAYLFIPDFTKFSFEAVLAALGQMFFSLCLASGVIITYGSYLSKGENIERSARTIEIFDTGVALLSALFIVPLAFIFSGGTPEALGSGPGLLFIQLPNVFGSMPFGTVFGAVFFACMILAAVTSAISMLEVIASALMEKFNISRPKAAGITTIGIFALGTIVALGYSIWSDVRILKFSIPDFVDTLGSTFAMPLLGLLTCIFAAWALKSGTKRIIAEAEENGQTFRAKKFYTVIIKYAAPVCLTALLVYLIAGLF